MLDNKVLDNHFETSCYENVNITKVTTTAKQIFDLVLNDWMFEYGSLYTRKNYENLYSAILQLVCQNKKMHFMLPGFPVKSPNTRDKVLSEHADYAEFLGLQSLIKTSHKIKDIYTSGVLVTIMSDYHTFDQYLGVPEKHYTTYHNDIKTIISKAGADDIIRVINLSSFPEFKDTSFLDLSNKLDRDYGDSDYLFNFDDIIKKDPTILTKYKQLLKFMMKDQALRLPGSPRSKQSRKLLKTIVRGMMAQGVALDNFLKQQTFLKDYIRLSIHNHHPKSNKFAIDLFKKYNSKDDVLRTPWHHMVVYDATQGEYTVTYRDHVLSSTDSRSFICSVKYNDSDWLYLKMHLIGKKSYLDFDSELNDVVGASLVKENYGLILTNNKAKEYSINADIIDRKSYVNLVKEFGFVTLKGFESFENMEVGEFRISTSKEGSIILTPNQYSAEDNAELVPDINSQRKKMIGRTVSLPPMNHNALFEKSNYKNMLLKDFLQKYKQNSAVTTKKDLKQKMRSNFSLNETSKLSIGFPEDIKLDRNILHRTRSWKEGLPLKRQFNNNFSFRVLMGF